MTKKLQSSILSWVEWISSQGTSSAKEKLSLSWYLSWLTYRSGARRNQWTFSNSLFCFWRPRFEICCMRWLLSLWIEKQDIQSINRLVLESESIFSGIHPHVSAHINNSAANDSSPSTSFCRRAKLRSAGDNRILNAMSNGAVSSCRNTLEQRYSLSLFSLSSITLRVWAYTWRQIPVK